MRYADPDGQFAFALPITVTVLEWSFGAAAVASAPVWFPAVGATVAAALVVYGCNELYNHISNKTDDEALDEKEKRENQSIRDQETNTFPENPDDLLPDVPRDDKGRIYAADNLRIRPEKHQIKPGEEYNPRHHGQHYHVETRRDPADPKWKDDNKEIIKPPGYRSGMGTGFLPGENFPGAI